MKRCVICGHEGDDSSTVCEACGSPYIEISKENTEMPESVLPEMPDQNEAENPETSDTPAADMQPAGETFESVSEAAEQTEDTPVTVRPSTYAQRAQEMVQQQYGSSAGSADGSIPYRHTQQSRENVKGEAPVRQPSGSDRSAMRHGQQMPAQEQPPRRAAQAQNIQPGRASAMPQMALSLASRKRFRSFLFLMVLLTNTAYVGASIINILMKNVSYTQLINIVKDTEGTQAISSYITMVESFLKILDRYGVVVGLITMIPAVLFCLALWAALFTSGAKRPAMGKAGFTLARITLVLKTIAVSILLVVCLILSVTFVISAWAAGDRMTQIVAVIVIVLMIIFTMIVIMYYFCCLHTVKVCKNNAVLGREYGKVSCYVAVINVIIALFSIINLLSAIVNYELPGIVGYGCQIAWLLLISLWIFRYRAKINQD